MIADLIQTATVTATLADGSSPLAPPVYVGSWDTKGEKVTTVIAFGPHDSRVAFDHILVSFNGGEPTAMRAAPDGLPISLPAGVPFEYEITLSDSYVQVD